MNKAVLGVGSAHGDDQIGWHLVDCLSQLDHVNDIEFEKISAPGASLIDCFRRYDQILLIDAGELGLKAGEFSLIKKADDYLLVNDSQPTHFSSHSLGVVDAYRLAQQLQIPLPQISLFLVQIEHTDTMAPISNTLQMRIADYIQRVERFVSDNI